MLKVPHNNQITGKVAELAAMQYYLDKGYNVFIPLIDNGADFIIYANNEYKSVQVKSGKIKTRYSKLGTPFKYLNVRLNTQSQNPYSKRTKVEADFLFIYSTEAMYIIPSDNIRVDDSLCFTFNNTCKYDKYKID